MRIYQNMTQWMKQPNGLPHFLKFKPHPASVTTPQIFLPLPNVKSFVEKLRKSDGI